MLISFYSTYLLTLYINLYFIVCKGVLLRNAVGMYGIFTIKYQTDSQSHANIECDLLSTVHTISVPFGRQCMQFEPGWPPVHAI